MRWWGWFLLGAAAAACVVTVVMIKPAVDLYIGIIARDEADRL